MKKFIYLILLIAMVISCKSGPKFSDVTGKVWKLIEINVDGKEINFQRDVLNADGFGEIFTLTFDANNISGKAAPNVYSAPYTTGKEQALNITPMRSTLMASIFEPQKFRESDFFKYMEKAYKWDLENNNLKILSKTDDNKEVILVFTL